MPAEARRSEARLPNDEGAVITVLQADLHPRLECHVLDRSKTGMRLGLPVALEPGALIQIRQQVAITMAEVRYCVPVGDSFHISARILSTMASGENASG